MSKADDTIFYKLQPNWVVYIFAFIGGYIDTVGYINLEQIFTSSITGNIVVACSSIVEELPGAIARALTTFLFFIGGCLATYVSLKLKQNQINKYRVAIILCSFQIFSFVLAFIFTMTLYYKGYRFNNIDSFQVIIAGMLLGFSMGVQNGVAQEMITDCPATTVMTMTIVKLSSNVSTSLKHYISIKTIDNTNNNEYQTLVTNFNKSTEKVRTLFAPLLYFIIGAIIGSAINKGIYFYCLFIPIFLLCVIMVDILYAEYYALQNQRNNDILLKTIDSDSNKNSIDNLTIEDNYASIRSEEL